MKTLETAYIGIGTNLGDRLQNITSALAKLDHREGITLRQVSRIYETPPWGITDQPAFFNLCAQVETSLSPHDLLQELLAVEQELKRVRIMRWGPRTIDLDLLLYGDKKINTEELILPHPRITERAFVLVPLADIAPRQLIPGTEMTVTGWLSGRPDADEMMVLPISLREFVSYKIGCERV